MARMFNPPHPGRMVAETLEYLGISAREFARHIGVAPSTVTRIIKEKSPITPEMAVRISAAISGPSPEAWLAMQALQTQQPEKALLVSPIVDMENLILDLMQQAGVTEEQLRTAGEIPTAMGETLSWPYLCWVREHPLHWKVPTQVLYADTDPLTGHTAMEQFRQQTGAHLTILEGGEHWFHTETQLAALQGWESCHI